MTLQQTLEVPDIERDQIGPTLELSIINGAAYNPGDYWLIEKNDVAVNFDDYIKPADSLNKVPERFEITSGGANNDRTDVFGRPIAFQNLVYESRLTIEDWHFPSIQDHAITLGCFNQKTQGGNNGQNDRGFRFQSTNSGSNVRNRWYPSQDHVFHQSNDHNIVSDRAAMKTLILRFFPSIDGVGYLCLARGRPENITTVSRTSDVTGADPTDDIDQTDGVQWNLRTLQQSGTEKFIGFTRLVLQNFSEFSSR